MTIQIIAGVIVFGFVFVIGFVSLMEWANINRHKELLKKLEEMKK